MRRGSLRSFRSVAILVLNPIKCSKFYSNSYHLTVGQLTLNICSIIKTNLHTITYNLHIDYKTSLIFTVLTCALQVLLSCRIMLTQATCRVSKHESVTKLWNTWVSCGIKQVVLEAITPRRVPGHLVYITE